MAEQWYWKHGRDLIGPIDTAALENLVRQHRVRDRDQVRPADSEDWSSGAEIRRLFESNGSGTASPSEAASRVLNQNPNVHRHAHIQQRRGGGTLSGIIGSTTDGLAAVVGKALELLRNKVVLGVLAVLGVLFVLTRLDIDLFANSRTYDQLSSAFARLQVVQQQPLRERSQEDVEEFRSDTSAWLNPVITSLEEQMKNNPVSRPRLLGLGESTARARWNMLGAARDLKALIADANVPSARSEDFTHKMELADFYLTGNVPPNAVNRGRFETVGSVDPLTLFIIAADVLLVVGGLIYWQSRRGKS